MVLISALFAVVLQALLVSGQTCQDRIPDCADYTLSVCVDPTFAGWVKDNCPKFCNLCPKSTPPPPTVATCSDRLPDCKAYGASACTGSYEPWAIDNCAKTCNLCAKAHAKTSTKPATHATTRSTTPSTTTPMATTAPCVDALPNCAAYTKTSCVGQYEPWAIANCPVFCGLCHKVKPATIKPPQQTHCTSRDGNKYPQGGKWTYGCDYKCECTDASTGSATCRSRCPIYQNVPSHCTMEQDPSDSCCKIPKCGHNVSLPPTHTHSTYKPGVSIPVSTNMCYHSKSNKYYKQGEKWDEGCDWQCECTDAKVGRYRCVERCGKYKSIPSECVYVTDPNDSCCKVPKCPPLMSIKSIRGPDGKISLVKVDKPVQTTCTYKGTTYKKGETWYDGCDYFCECHNPENGQYRCRGRCPVYSNIPSTCSMITDPADKCCKKPSCPHSTIASHPVNSTPKPNMCLYKGKQYATGQKWEDGCKFRCECTDGSKGATSCQDRCPTYQSVPSTCSMVQDPNDSCCLKPSCPPTSVTIKIPPGGLTAPPRSTCIYNGQRYPLGAKWEDGCTARCTCEQDATYKCTARCPQFVMPKECFLAPPKPGKCCSLPTCPSHIKVHIPPGFEE